LELDGLWEREAELDGDSEAEGDCEAELEELGLRLALGESEAEGLKDAEGDWLAELELEGLREAEAEAEGLREALGEREADAELDGDKEAEGLIEAEEELDGDRDAEETTTAVTWAPSVDSANATQPAVLSILTMVIVWPASQANISEPEESTLLIFSPLWVLRLNLTEAKRVILCPLGTSDRSGKRT
jgi:hypothetical protein